MLLVWVVKKVVVWTVWLWKSFHVRGRDIGDEWSVLTFLLVRKKVGEAKTEGKAEMWAVSPSAVMTGLCIRLWTWLFTVTSAGVANGTLRGNNLICGMCTSVPTVTTAPNFPKATKATWEASRKCGRVRTEQPHGIYRLSTILLYTIN